MSSSNRHLPTILLLTLSLTSLGLLPLIHNAHAATSLFGSIFTPAGWGFTTSTITTPGPAIVVNAGASVSLSLASADGVTHNWGVDYNGNGVCDSGEPCAANFGSTPQPFSFTATTIAGNYTYWCFIHKGPMFGTLVVKAVHNAAVSSLTVSRNFAYNSITSNPIQVNVTAENLGTGTDTFAVYAKANNTLIGNQTITLNAGASKVVSFNWNPELLARGNYILTANATRITGETDFSNNQLTGGTFQVKFRGDVNGDCKVDIADLATVGASFGKTQASPGFNPDADLNNDATTNIVDLVLVASSFGQAC